MRKRNETKQRIRVEEIHEIAARGLERGLKVKKVNSEAVSAGNGKGQM